jgi:hypothetical protein
LLGNFGSKEDEMSANKFIDAFKRDAVAPVEGWGYWVREVAERLGGRCSADDARIVESGALQPDCSK